MVNYQSWSKEPLTFGGSEVMIRSIRGQVNRSFRDSRALGKKVLINIKYKTCVFDCLFVCWFVCLRERLGCSGSSRPTMDSWLAI